MFNDIPQKPTANSLKTMPPQGRQLGKWLNEADEIFSYLERHQAPKESAEQPIDSTLILLKQAHDIILESEKRMKEQAVRIERLETLSNTDELTGMSNRRNFMHLFSKELDRVNRDKSQGGLLIMIDLDNFKSINDVYGHDAGDAALKLIATTLESDIRTMDIASRLGGDEFVILFVNTNRKQALERAQFLIKKLNNLSFIWNETEVPVRASLGLKEYRKGSKAEHIFTAADVSMYENKQQTKTSNTRQDNKAL